MESESNIKPSWVILTYNRKSTVIKSLVWNTANAGFNTHEVIHVDNGSHDGVREYMASCHPAIQVLHKDNLGVAKGYNRGMLLATGTHIVITGCDRQMPHNWLKKMVECFEKIPETGVVSMYSQPLDVLPERLRGPKEGEIRNGIHIVHAMPFGARMMRRELLEKAGLMREDFGLYGHEDREYADRLERVCKENNWICYTLPTQIPEHDGSEGIKDWNGRDHKDYHAFKKAECEQSWKDKLVDKCRKENNPYYNPYAGAR